MPQTLWFFYEEWAQYNRRLLDAIAPLSAEQLSLRAGPSSWPIWGIAAHTAGARVYWLCGVLKEPGAETTPFIDPTSGEGWEDHPNHPRDARELVTALDSSWRIVKDSLSRWTPDMLEDRIPRQIGSTAQIHTRRSVIMRMLSHDAFHTGEISSILGSRGAPEIDLWRAAP